MSSNIGLHDWTRVINFGAPESLAEPLQARAVQCNTILRLDRTFAGGPGAGYRLDGPDMSAHIVVSLDYIHRVPPLESALSEIHRVIAPGGQFVFTVPFRVNSKDTSSFTSHLPRVGGLLPAEFGAEVHEIAWDILDRLRNAGFADAAAHLYWSEELGYLGPFNFIFSAGR